MKRFFAMLFFSLFTIQPIYARACQLPERWRTLCPILEERTTQSIPKMKLTQSTRAEFEHFLCTQNLSLVSLNKLQKALPKTTLELLMGIRFREVSPIEAEKMADYLMEIVQLYRFKNIKEFDNNTSHIIGREWCEIDYTGEGMTWQGQKAKYAPYKITNFKTVENIQRFFPVESKLPYFRKIYQPRFSG